MLCIDQDFMMKNSITVGLDNAVEIVGCHAEGEVGDVIIGGVSSGSIMIQPVTACGSFAGTSKFT